MTAFNLTILASDKPFFNGKCESVILPTSHGEYGVLAHHRNMIAAITTGMLKYRPENDEMHIASVSDGIIKIEKGDVLVLVDTIERPEEIDANRAQLEIDKANEALLQKRTRAEYEASRARLARAINRLKAKNYRISD